MMKMKRCPCEGMPHALLVKHRLSLRAQIRTPYRLHRRLKGDFAQDFRLICATAVWTPPDRRTDGLQDRAFTHADQLIERRRLEEINAELGKPSQLGGAGVGSKCADRLPETGLAGERMS